LCVHMCSPLTGNLFYVHYVQSVDQCSEIDDLRQEIRDLQLEMEEIHDRFRDDERTELRELQRELEGTAKNCRMVNFKLRKAERKVRMKCLLLSIITPYFQIRFKIHAWV